MQTKNTNLAIKSGVLLALTMLSLTMFATPSQAIVRDSSVVTKLKDERNTLLIKEQRLMEDYDDLQRQLRDLEKRDNDPRAKDQLCRDIDAKFSDLQSIRYSIKNVEMRLM